MLETYFKYPGVLRRMRRGPLGAGMDDLAEELARIGYTRATARRYLSLVASFSRHAERAGCAAVDAVDRPLVSSFIAGLRAATTRTLALTALAHVLPGLVGRGAHNDAKLSERDAADAPVLASFERFLLDVRGLVPRSAAEIVLLARRMLHWYRARDGERPLSDLGGKDVLAFVAHLAGTCVATGTRSAAVSHLRGWLRYLNGEGVLRDDLARLVPQVPIWRQANIPGYLDWADVRTVIEAIDPAEPTADRDRALLLILATTGLRNQEVRLLELRDIDWRTGQLHIRRTKARRERVVPLLGEAGQALADYVLNSRPRNAGPTVFLRHVPPVAALPYSSSVAAIVRRRLARCGFRPPRAGAHLLRHSLATRLVQQGQRVKDVADILGHRSIDTTAVYVKVAVPQLASVALPFPGVTHG